MKDLSMQDLVKFGQLFFTKNKKDQPINKLDFLKVKFT